MKPADEWKADAEGYLTDLRRAEAERGSLAAALEEAVGLLAEAVVVMAFNGISGSFVDSVRAFVAAHREEQ